MTDYIITPDKKESPSSHRLSEELHRRALSVEMDVKGTNYKWENIHFYDPITPETRCFVERNIHSLVYKISLSPDSTHESEELQKALVEIILLEVGGKVYDPTAKESHDLKSFQNLSIENGSSSDEKSESRKSKMSLPSSREIVWIVFSWALVLFGIYVYLNVPEPRKIFVLATCVLALISAGGITFSKTK